MHILWRNTMSLVLSSSFMPDRQLCFYTINANFISVKGNLYPGMFWGASLVAQMVKNLPAVWDIWVRSLGWRKSPGKRYGKLLHYSCLENSADRGVWRATDHGVTESGTTEHTHYVLTSQTHWKGLGIPKTHLVTVVVFKQYFPQRWFLMISTFLI